MPQEPNRFLRVLIPAILGLGGLFIAIAVMKNAGKQHAAPPITANNPAPAAQPAGPSGQPAPNQPAAQPTTQPTTQP
ncbi:MAG: hypothetical protein HUU19_12400, partial [Phycisphaerales bacterium]|nr:hypothetical protein [Phycisphaerales bacterium]